jgi:hypothetical protein
VEVLDHDDHGCLVGQSFDRLDEALGEEESRGRDRAGLEHGARDAQGRSEQRAGARVERVEEARERTLDLELQAAPESHRDAVGARAIGEDAGDAGFPGPRLTDDGDAVARPLPGGQQTVAEPRELVITPDESPGLERPHAGEA